MTTVFLVLVAAAVFVLGQRYFARFMLATTFADPPPAAAGGAPAWAGMAQHAAAVAGGTTVAGTAIAAVWGWSPAYLWIVVGTAVIAGTCVLGARWISLKAGGRPLGEIAAGVLGLRGALLFAALSLLFLAAINAVAAVMLGRALAAQPAAAIALWVQVPLALVLARSLARGGALAALAAVTATAVVAVPVLIAARWAPLHLDGALDVALGGTPLLRLDAALAWTLAALAYAMFALRRPAARLSLARGVIAAGGGVILVGLVLAAVLVTAPGLAAPEVNRQAALPGVLPWLLLVLTGGAAGALHGLLGAAGGHEPGAPPPAGYGAALAVGAVAVAVLVACTAGVSPAETWHLLYPSWGAVIHPNRMVEVFLGGFAQLAHDLGIARDFAADLGALVVAGLALATLEAGLRLQFRLLVELTPERPDDRRRELDVAWIAVALVAAVALLGRHAGTGEVVWPLLGAASHLITVGVLGVVTLAALRLGRPAAGVLVPLAVVGAGLAWGLGAVIVHGWQTGGTVWTVGGTLLLAAEAWLIAEGIMAYRQTSAAASAARGTPP